MTLVALKKFVFLKAVEQNAYDPMLFIVLGNVTDDSDEHLSNALFGMDVRLVHWLKSTFLSPVQL